MLEDKIVSIKEKLIKMANIVEEMVKLSVKALAEKKLTYAKKVIDELEPQVNSLEIEIDEQAIEALALYHPEAKDLRVVSMIMKMVKDLERVGDHSVNIAEFGLQLIPQPDVKPYIDLPRMADISAKMLDDAITAFISQDIELSKDILKRDDIVDALNDQIIRELITFMLSDPATINRAVLIMRVSENMERIADQATNIAEYVIYIEESKVVKHHFEEP
ncbi:MAG: phosphate transport system regulatory protein PhoU [Caldiserica bacterium CG02_land_8_20_14_3_00_36_38]|jgi:phosphate transport system protein|nr:phosphate signaling complex protein PhoU [Caldisericota bacterium]OIP12390.1 MAG: phosphate transport system regulatory protein PhoU [Caldisericum sp. CG2_30_36_11]PIP49350.1 MAG: phosphate transport system regulatory protein PhoU [Caldiserica bacterium CG23_combo_of_CG06-09_8_20_14_all_35_60]PIV55251.1 MAG: phosphate transport system regulatory protein PhoU [Caldiserica bacterium CG02_land_8_20_14_3_00_36_38]PIX29472.1 MAG: phosphate transport system regulatory protein PhoU [Caldiserica bac